MRHAPYAVAGFVFLVGKTTKTACGKRVARAKLATRDDTDCPACQRAIADDKRDAERLHAVALDMLATSGCPTCGMAFDDLSTWSAHNREVHGK